MLSVHTLTTLRMYTHLFWTHLEGISKQCQHQTTQTQNLWSYLKSIFQQTERTLKTSLSSLLITSTTWEVTLTNSETTPHLLFYGYFPSIEGFRLQNHINLELFCLLTPYERSRSCCHVFSIKFNFVIWTYFLLWKQPFWWKSTRLFLITISAHLFFSF